MTTDAWGIDDGWWSADGSWRTANPDTVEQFRSLVGDPHPHPDRPSAWFVRRGTEPGIDRPAELELEDGSVVAAGDRLPHDLPLGYHRLRPSDGGPPTPVVCVPEGVPTWPERTWGVVAQTFSLPSAWGVGDLAELRRVGHWLSARGGTVLATSPLGDPLPIEPREPSPYSPSSRAGIDPAMVDLGLLGVPVSAAPPPITGPIDRARSWKYRRSALRAWWDTHRPASNDPPGPGEPGSHAVFTALAEAFGHGWREWPDELRRHDDPAVARAAAARRDDVAFWHWVDEVADDQLVELSSELRGMGVTMMGDLPVGFDPNGFDAWIDRATLVEGVSIGAPPDQFNPAGQDWQLPPYSPVGLLAAGYEPFLRTIRAQFRRYGGLRIDHVMGLFRLFWIPQGGEPGDGTYVRFRSSDLIDLVVLEATRAGAFVVGEDLGTVEPGVREAMLQRGIASTKVALFEASEPEWWPARSLGTITTHDLPTVRGLMDDSDPWHDAGLAERLRRFAGIDDAAPDAAEVSLAAHRRLAASGSDLVLATLEDVAGSAVRVNLPGTIDEYPNWRVPLPLAAEDLGTDAFAAEVSATMADR